MIYGTTDWSFLFTDPGTFLFRTGAFIGLPIFYTNEELWNGIEQLGEFDTDTVTFDFGLPHIQEITIAQPCDWNWLPVIEGYIDETGLPNYDEFKVTLKAFFTTNDPPQSYKLRWVLQNISWYDGAAMNYRPDSTSLRFLWTNQ
ncbi:MAG: hypothetical protein NTW14_01470 [bacterium]|nr:hypothetical protein [bacterium]